MSSERKLRLNQVAREFNVGLSTITDFLAKKGINIESSPNTIVGADAYAVLEKEFGGNRADGRVNIRERINLKQETVSLDKIKGAAPDKNAEPDFKDEVVIKTGGVISVKDEVAQRSPKIVGKIDLSAGKPKPQAPAPKPESVKEAKPEPPAAPQAQAPKPSVETPAPQAKPSEIKPRQETVPTPQPAPAPQIAAEKKPFAGDLE
ncbi:MAG: hypothetical protein LIO77_02915 [Rikenellaceae bacterium]|nr:hypothetical protein [Rikenellaceae bacterium]